MASTRQQSPLRLSSPIQQLSGVGTHRAKCLERLGIHTVSDLLRHLPMRYERQEAESTIADLPMQGIGSARGTVVATRWVPAYAHRGKSRFEATLQDHSDRLHLVWFNAQYLKQKIHPGLMIRAQGKVKAFAGYPQMVNPQWQPLEVSSPVQRAQARLRPVYPATEDLSGQAIESLIAAVLPDVQPLLIDPLPQEFVRQHAMPALDQAFTWVHQPPDEQAALAGRRRLAFNELLLLQLGIALKRHYNEHELQAPPLRWSAAIDEHIQRRFPFELTAGQRQVISDIVTDLQKRVPMNRLLQGDVGSGKTVVALYALLMAVANRKQGALMAPTELLAEQHHQSIAEMLRRSTVRLGLLTAGQAPPRSPQRRTFLADVREGRVDIVIGTQALLGGAVRFRDLAVVVIDEQHRFGVLQRAAFRNPLREAGDSHEITKLSPHYLVMTATPIPRTLSLTIFGDLDVSTIQGLPPGRTPIATRVVNAQKADEVYRYLAQRLASGQQAYVVVPAIESSGAESSTDLKNVRAHARLLQDKYCRGFRVAAVHGRLKRQTRESIMARFRAGQIHVLVATTVIEVGVDVPNAAMMIVEHAERFGLAQLHQLRGRVGRGRDGRKSLCVFIAEPGTSEAEQRLAAIAATHDGFQIAEQDLQIRGMGDFFGTRQHGLPPLRVARIPEDLALLQQAQRDARHIVQKDPQLADPDWRRLRQVLLQQYGDALGLIDVG